MAYVLGTAMVSKMSLLWCDAVVAVIVVIIAVDPRQDLKKGGKILWSTEDEPVYTLPPIVGKMVSPQITQASTAGSLHLKES